MPYCQKHRPISDWLTCSIRVYISSLSEYFALKFRHAPPARKKGFKLSATKWEPCSFKIAW